MTNAPSQPVRAAIVGASGYVGRELAAILASHPGARLEAAFRASASGGPETLPDLHPRLRGLTDLPVLAASPAAIADADPHVVFLATPHRAAHDLAPVLLAQGRVVIDCSAAFRLTDFDAFERAYGFRHGHEALAREAAYGLPELDRRAIAGASLIAAPGCYATAAILAIAPAARAGLLAPGTAAVVDAVSGVSGAGRSPNDRTHFPHVSCQPYNVLAHRHAPEIAEHAGAPVHFVPHLGEWDRGILATVHLELASATDAAGLAAVYRGAYADEPFVRLLPPGAWPAVADVRHTNFADLAFTLDDAGTHAVVVAAIDNLVKGAAGQAVQCMNIRFGIDEGVLGPIPGPPTGAVATP